MSPPPGRPSGPRPPAWLEGLLGLLVPGDLWTSVREDLRERFAAVAQEQGRSGAQRWYLRQIMATLSPFTLAAMWAGKRRSGRSSRGITNWPGSVGADVRHAFRRMAKVPGPTAAAVLMLALGVGGGTGVYGIHQAFGELTDAGLREPERIRVVALRDSAGRLSATLPARAAPDLLASLPEGAASLISARPALLRIGDDAALRTVEAVTPGHFRLAGVSAALGRALTPDDAGARVLVLSHDVWRERLGSDPDVLGSVVHVDREPYTVVGVAPRGFRDLAFAAAWMPLDGAAVPEGTGVTEVVRIPEGPDGRWPSLERRLESAVRAAGEPGDASGDLSLVRIEELSSPGERSLLAAFFAMLGALSLLVLLAASANVANLGTAQVLARQRELALRLSLGASKGRLVRLVVTELLVLGLLAGGAAMAVVLGLTRLIARWLPPSTADVVTFQVRAGHVQVALLLSVAAALLSALLPVLRTPRTHAVLRAGPGSARGGGPGRIQAGLVVVQVFLSV
ncbi:MAG TPA: ABC transporter permease, partial [Longimicrobiales bacterium]|nr:ABC transporter permease [Longimicrobiales bacterium]